MSDKKGQRRSGEGISRAEFRAVADRVELTELLSRYHQYIDGMKWESLKQVFVEDAECHYLGLDTFGVADVSLEGREKIIEWLRVNLGQFGDTQPKHFFANHVFEILGDRARTRSYMHVVASLVTGVYEVEHQRTPEGWRVVKLRLEHFRTEQAR
ncbi:MAG: nuclear transport factor 2 family protein [Myxococcales bacterium]|nr:nuclear transport factor 2 family protein [Myxococcales bacterium]